MRALLLLALAACADSAPEAVKPDTHHDTVYQCGGTGRVIGEWCWSGTADELSQHVRALCWPSEDERFCVGPLGACLPWCRWCCGDDCPAHGANALNGPYCEES